jgi:cobalt/nickel transport system permease protein
MRRLSIAAFVLLGLTVAVALVILVAPNANANPDGLERVAAEQGIDTGGVDHALADSPLADYGVDGVDHRYAGTWVAGLVGVAVAFTIVTALLLVVRRARGSAPEASSSATA